MMDPKIIEMRYFRTEICKIDSGVAFVIVMKKLVTYI